MVERIQVLARIQGALAPVRPELSVALVALLFGGIGVLAGLPLVLPDARSLGFVEQHYFRPLVVAAVAQAVAVGFARRKRPDSGSTLALLAACLLVAVTLLVHFNLKAWMPLVHPRLFDAELQRSDWGFGELVPWLVAVRGTLASVAAKVGLPFDAFYHHAFVALFFVSFSAHALFDGVHGLRRVVLGACLVLLLGGVLYWLLPAKGPFVFRPSASAEAAAAQAAMGAAFDEFVKTGAPPAGYFVAPLAAMPSLHAAHATLFTVFAFRRLKWLGWPFALVLAGILVEAVATGWHYVLDLPVGMALAVFCVWLAERMLPEQILPDPTPGDPGRP